MTPQRYKLTLAYRGTNYHGWQRQSVTESYKGPLPPEGNDIPTIQQLLRQAIESVVRHPVTLVGSSRTDARVHAKGQLAHFDTDQLQIPIEGMRRAINAALPEDQEWHDKGAELSAESKQPWVWEGRIRRKDGRMRSSRV